MLADSLLLSQLKLAELAMLLEPQQQYVESTVLIIYLRRVHRAHVRNIVRQW